MDLLARYSNRPDLLQRLSHAIEREADGDSSSVAGVVDHAPGSPRLTQDRLTSEDINELIAAFQAGTAKHILVKRYGLGETTVKRLLRARGVRTTWLLAPVIRAPSRQVVCS